MPVARPTLGTHMNNPPVVVVAFCCLLVASGKANEAQLVADNGSAPTQPDTKMDRYAEAFAKAQADIQGRMNRAIERARVQRPQEWCGGVPGMAIYSPWGTDWWAVVAEHRSVVEKLVNDHGGEIASYLRDHADDAPLLTLLTLDALGRHNQAAQVSVRLMPKWGQDALLWVSFCSTKTREAAANQLASKMPPRQRAFGGLWSLKSLADFIAVTGNAHTIQLLEELTETPEGQPRKVTLERAIGRIRTRVSLPAEEQAQRARDELLFWQAAAGAPVPRNVDSGLVFAANCLIAQKLTVSSAYLIEQLEQPGDEKQMNRSRVKLALLILANQKDNDAVPAMVTLVRHNPSFREDVESTLKQLDTAEARKALRELPNVRH